MTAIAKIRIAAPIAGVLMLQVLLPVVLMVFLFQIKSGQRELIEEKYDCAGTFQQIQLSQEEKINDVVGDKELLYGGILYDIRSMVKNGAKYVFTVLPDKKEADFYKLGIVKNGMGMTLESRHVYPVPFFLLYFQQQDNTHYLYARWAPGMFTEQQISPINSLSQKIPKPPPQFFTV